MGGSSSFVSTGLFDYQLGGNSSTVGALQTKSFDLNGAVLTINSEVSPQLHLAWDAAAFVANAASFGDVPLINSPSASGHEFSAAFSNAWGFEHLHQ
jgi:hypothetical protein